MNHIFKIVICFTLAILLSSNFISHAKPSQNNYESFLSDGYFKEQDSKLNVLYKKLMDSIPPVQKSVLLHEQRYWNKELFDVDFNKGKKENDAAQAAISALERRNKELEKVLQSGQTNPFGLSVKWGMTPLDVCEALGIQGTEICQNINFEYSPNMPENKHPFIKKLMGEETPVDFTFLKTSFFAEAREEDKEKTFTDYNKFLKKVESLFGVRLMSSVKKNSGMGFDQVIVSEPLQLLVALGASLDSEDGYSLLEENFPKKYKSVFVKDSSAINYREDFDLTTYADFFPKTRLFEDKTSYIQLVPTGGTMVFSFFISYDDKEYFLLNIPDKEVLVKKLMNAAAYKSSFSICPEDADLKTVIYAFGGHPIKYERESPAYYTLIPQFKDMESYDNIELLMTNDDKLFAFRIPYNDSPQSTVNADAILPQLARLYKDMGEDNPLITQFNEFSSNMDRNFESKSNYIALYFNRWRGSYCFMAVNRDELVKQARIVELESREKEKKAEKNREELKKTLNDF